MQIGNRAVMCHGKKKEDPKGTDWCRSG